MLSSKLGYLGEGNSVELPTRVHYDSRSPVLPGIRSGRALIKAQQPVKPLVMNDFTTLFEQVLDVDPSAKSQEKDSERVGLGWHRTLGTRR